MKNPTIKQVEYVIEKLESVREQASKEGAFYMREGRVYDKEYKYKCGTIHCVGGWYAFANLGREFIAGKIKKGCVSFVDGAELLARDLGLGNLNGLCNWAFDNPKIWGNKNGFDMFSNENTYDNPGYAGVISQWVNVRDNLIKLEEEY
jgi:hypothetical protein